MEEAVAQVAAPVVIHQSLAGRFCSTHQMAKKRGLAFHSSSFVHQSATDNWSPKSWNWDCARFVAKPLQSDGGQVGDGAGSLVGINSEKEPQPVSRPNKRVRSGSPAGANYPMCQVDNCKEDLSAAKDYHRRHKVCEVHSKATKALVGTQMQRFCQQCSRFHPLSEFDEGKRSCRRRLAGHNRRRRKTQPEDTAPRLVVPGLDNNAACDMDIVNLLAVLAQAQGNAEERGGVFSSVPNKDQLIQIIGKINSLPLPANLAAKLPLFKNTNGSIPSVVSSEDRNQVNGNVSSPSTVDLLAVLSATRRAPSSEMFEIQSQPSTDISDSEKCKSSRVDRVADLNLQRGPITEISSVGGERSSRNYHSYVEDADCHAQETSPSLPLQLFSSSPEDDSSRKFPLWRNYMSSDSSNPSAEISPMSSPPVVHDLFPMKTSRETLKHDHLSTSEGDIAYGQASMNNQCSTSLQLFGGPTQVVENASIQSSPEKIGYTSSSGSDHSLSSLNSDAQDRTGRIIFKLFDKDPSHLPGSLRTQIYNWLSNIPSEMESYIRPGCVVLSLYLSMPSVAWGQLEENLVNFVKSLVKNTDSDFWGNARFLVHTERQMASHKDGKFRLCKSWRAWTIPELISVSPLAVVSGQETSLLLRGRCLTSPGTKIHCTHASGFNICEISALSSRGNVYDEISLGSFKIQGEASNVLGRCFIEVENNFRCSSFPVIIADNAICRELRLLEPELCGNADVYDGTSTNHVLNNTGRPGLKEEILHFLDELGWLFQRKHNSSLFGSPDYRLNRFKFLLIFSVEHDFCALVKILLGILLELSLCREGLAREALEMLSEIQLLSRAVKRRCRSMVDLLIRYSVVDSTHSSKRFIFLPSMAGPGGFTPLHLAACTSSSEDLVDALTSDPQAVGLQCWNSLLDANGLSPYAYALMRNNHSYNALVTRKLADMENGEVSLAIENEIEQFQVEVERKIVLQPRKEQISCSRCAAAFAYGRKFPGSQGLLQRPYIHSMLVIAAVCVCVCLFLRGHPYVGRVAPFAWENLRYGTM